MGKCDRRNDCSAYMLHYKIRLRSLCEMMDRVLASRPTYGTRGGSYLEIVTASVRIYAQLENIEV